LAAENWKFDSNSFLFNFFKTYASGVLFCSSRRVEQNSENKISNRNHMCEINYFNFFHSLMVMWR
jgi:hypothetical protein